MIKRIPVGEIHTIKPLWEKLNAMHEQDSRYFKEHYQSFTFEKRIGKIRKLKDADVFLEILENNDMIFGYCLTTKNALAGEIDSLYIDDSLRGRGWGRKLVERALLWLKKNNCQTIRVSVADGHEQVLSFYRQFGFKPRLTVLEQLD